MRHLPVSIASSLLVGSLLFLPTGCGGNTQAEDLGTPVDGGAGTDGSIHSSVAHSSGNASCPNNVCVGVSGASSGSVGFSSVGVSVSSGVSVSGVKPPASSSVVTGGTVPPSSSGVTVTSSSSQPLHDAGLPPPVDAASCATGKTCGGACVDEQTDNANCGSCGTRCTGGATCQAGTCQCYDNGQLCNGVCVDTESDPNNCGACNKPCTTNPAQVCSAGVCTTTCAGGTTNCDNACVDTTADPDNCGTCGMVCGTGANCVSGTCTCGAGTSLCGPDCVDLATNQENCGTCGNRCMFGETCTAGNCGMPTSCPGTETLCTGGGFGGGGGGGMFSTCANLETDAQNCGACGSACPAGGTCTGGSCFCPSGESACTLGMGGFGGGGGGGAQECVNLQTDGENCGSCGMRCTGGQVCNQGACGPECTGGLVPCSNGGGFGGGGMGAQNSCVDTNTDVDDCGLCGARCGANQVCTNGTCACASGTVVCGGDCADLQTDNDNCGTCGTECGAGLTCTAGQCG